MRMELAHECEEQTQKRLVELGYTVEPFGQALLSPTARAMLAADDPDEMRWFADFLVTRPPHFGPKVPAALGEQKLFLVDAKYSFGETSNLSIEDRSLLSADKAPKPTWFVHSVPGSRQIFGDFSVIYHRQVLHHRWEPCCATCGFILQTDKEAAMTRLPKYCPTQRKTAKSSATPFVVIPLTEMHPLTENVFDLGLDQGVDWKWCGGKELAAPTRIEDIAAPIPTCRVVGCTEEATNFRPDLPQLAMCTEHRADRMAGRPIELEEKS